MAVLSACIRSDCSNCCRCCRLLAFDVCCRRRPLPCRLQVHLALDTSGQGGRMGVRAFVSRALGLGGNELAREFLEASLGWGGGWFNGWFSGSHAGRMLPCTRPAS